MNIKNKIDDKKRIRPRFAFGRACDTPMFLRLVSKKPLDKKPALNRWETDGGKTNA